MVGIRGRLVAQAVAVVVAPLLLGAAYWCAVSPAALPGLYVLDHSQRVHPVTAAADVSSEAPSDAIDSRVFPIMDVPRIGALPASLYLYQPDRMTPPLDPSTIAVWYLVYDRRTDRELHTPPQPVTMSVLKVGDELYRLDSASLSHAWIWDQYATQVERLSADRRYARPALLVEGHVRGEQRRRRFFVPIDAQ